MTPTAVTRPPAKAPAPALFAATVFASAALVFMVEPMAAKLVLPLLGGSPSVWNTSLAFFQVALLVGYGYAHLLQRLRAVRVQVLVHGAAMIAAALVLPLHVSQVFGPPSSDHPALWLLGVLAASLGAPFAVLSATAPLVQAWHARATPDGAANEPYVLYAASNLGSLLALVAYPALIEPLSALHDQTLAWSVAYLVFMAMIAALALGVVGTPAPSLEAQADLSPPVAITWRTRLIWVALAALPSSLMMGVTTHLSTDVASAPFLWVVPLALYLITFIIAFQAKPSIPPELTLVLQAAAAAACAAVLPFKASNIVLQLFVHLSAFFLTALMCHQALVARRPHPSRLTEFYLWMSLGGVVGGSFNAFLAPVIFTSVWEYPLALALACLARPWDHRAMEPWRVLTLVLGVAACIAAPLALNLLHLELAVKLALAGATVAAFVARRNTLVFFALILCISISSEVVGDRLDVRYSWRSFFGVVRLTEMPAPRMGGTLRMLAHGTTLHGAQAQDPRYRCRPLVYYAPETPIGQVFTQIQSKRPAIRIGAVGLGTGAVSTYVRASDRLTFFEIDPLVIRISANPRYFSYTTVCAKGAIDYVVGDARLTLANQPRDKFDILLIDAFSSDAVPAHLLTVEAVRGYLTHIKPDGVLILHLSNRNLDLRGPAMAVAQAAGASALLQRHEAAKGSPPLWESSEDAVVLARNPQALAAFAADSRWTRTDPTLARPWTDDYTNLAGALYARQKERWTWLP